MTEEVRKQITELVTQLQQAHRLAASFYQHILPLFDLIANQALDAKFWFWNPIETDRTCRQETQPTSRSAWEFLPLFASAHAYRDHDGITAEKDEKAVIFRLYLDDDFRKDSALRARSKGVGEPDPLKMSGEAVIEVNLYHCLQDSNKHIWHLVNKAGWAIPQSDQWQQSASCPALEVCSKQRPLDEFLADPDSVTKWIQERSATAKRVIVSGQAS